MEVNINTGSEFKRQFKRLMKKYHSLLHDFDVWKQELKNNPLAGDDLGAGVRKIRMAINSKGKGKSGGARILTLNILLDAETMLPLAKGFLSPIRGNEGGVKTIERRDSKKAKAISHF